MGINISKPFIYLGNKKINLTNILKGKKYNIKDKIGSEKIHLEEHKTGFDMSKPTFGEIFHENHIFYFVSFLKLKPKGSGSQPRIFGFSWIFRFFYFGTPQGSVWQTDHWNQEL